MNILDRLIGYVSPQRAYERQAWRDAARNYDSGDNGRLNAGWGCVDAVKEANKVVSRYAADQILIKQWFKNVLGFLLLEIAVTAIIISAVTLIRM